MPRTVIEAIHPPLLIVPKQEVKDKLTALLEEGKTLRNSNILSEEDLKRLESQTSQWRDFVAEYLLRVFDNDSVKKSFTSAYGVMVMAMDINDRISNFEHDIAAKITSLESIIRRLELIPESPQTQSSAQNTSTNNGITNSKKIFIVHGHDEASKTLVAEYVKSIQLDPIILHEQANGGRTLIEKLEHYSDDVGYSIVIATPDDKGFEKNEQPESAKPRARQNVIMELGFFVGKLTRKRVCLLYQEGTELPTDLLGIVYIPFDEAENWKLLLARELKNAGIQFDTTAAF